MTPYSDDGKRMSEVVEQQISKSVGQRIGESVNGPDKNGFVLWFTGLSGSGKTTLAKLIEQECSLDRPLDGFALSSRPDTLKVVLSC